MPIKIPDNLPVREKLNDERIFVIGESRAFHQDIRPLSIIIVNLMPLKQDTELQLLRLLGNTPLQIEVKLAHMETHVSKNTSSEYLNEFYYVFDEFKDEFFDGMIITGAPVEHMPFEEVGYWPELSRVFEWSKTHVTSTFHICWGAQAGLYYHYGVNKKALPEKMFGIFAHEKCASSMLIQGFDDVFNVPHSRHTDICEDELLLHSDKLTVLSRSEESGVYIVASNDGRQIFVTGHSEYDAQTLNNEYVRDLSKGQEIKPPKNYFKDNDPTKPPVVTWKGHSNLLFANWLNYFVYQETPYEFAKGGSCCGL